MAKRTPATDVTPEEIAWGFEKNDTGTITAPVAVDDLRAMKTIDEQSGNVEYVVVDSRGDPVLVLDSLDQLSDYFADARRR